MAWRSLQMMRIQNRKILHLPKLRNLNIDTFLDLSIVRSDSIQRRSIGDLSSSTTASSPSTSRENPEFSTVSDKFTSSLKDIEVEKFSAIAETWWDYEGPFKPLHLMNPTRISFIRSALCRHFKKDPYYCRPFEGLKFLDVGCGGGILSEPLARMGATVMGIDAVEKNINVATLHSKLDPLTSTIQYRCMTAEQLVGEHRQFDAVISLEVIEHVADPSEFVKSLSALTVTDGATIISTINRSIRAYATAIIAASIFSIGSLEVLIAGPVFLPQRELVLILQRASISVQEMAGLAYNPLTREWFLSDDTSINFITFGTKIC